ncbi:fumarylacetoacetate hydrolase family protein [Leifsonia sp. Root112D2]|uniref:fumarylacetoacetate hydrolase family protein n=1 Tax=Leifsonia sp. Root112D2 TaxID=1736426 RepID=UPI000AAF194B|nr:fumarylacetoacetate hydrolase family protein [Leifsonia sp. Root112D2]
MTETDATRARPALALTRADAGGETLWLVRRGNEYSRLGMSLSQLLCLSPMAARQAVEEAAEGGASPDRVLAPIDPQQEVWAAGVTYLRSRDGRIEEASDGTPYDRVYGAERPELFFKSTGVRTRGPDETIGVRVDSEWNVPEPELGIVLHSSGALFGYVPGNDASSRSIEGENLLYLPQAKVFTAACALGPEIVPAWVAETPFAIGLEIRRDGALVFEGASSTDQMARGLDELADWLFRGLDFPDGVILLTGTGIVPEADFTLRAGDEVTVDIDGIGRLTNVASRVGRQGRK